jgi:glycosyltransferase involved in cell wall biosynthesis
MVNRFEERVTIITPSFNRVDLLPKTIESVISQSVEDFQYIIVDDGSTDGTWEYLQTLKDPRIILLSHPGRENRGQSASINFGLSNAAGKYIVILDSDDLLAEDALENHIDILERDSSLGMVYGQGYVIDSEGKIQYPIFSCSHQELNDPNALLLNFYIVSPGLCMFRREIVDRIGGLEEGFRAAQDHDFTLRVAEVSKIAYSGVDCFLYRKHAGTISVNGALTRWRNGFIILERAATRYPYRSEIIRKRRAVLCYRMGEVYRDSGQYFRAAVSFFSSAALDPVRAVGVVLGRVKYLFR